MKASEEEVNKNRGVKMTREICKQNGEAENSTRGGKLIEKKVRRLSEAGGNEKRAMGTCATCNHRCY